MSLRSFHISRFWLILALFFIVSGSYAQTDKQKELEARKQRRMDEIKQINSLLFTKNRERKDVLEEVQDLNKRIKVRQELISVNDQQARLLNHKIGVNLNALAALRKELEALKEDYANMVVKSYKSKSQESRLMFLLSSDNFLQAYKRVLYMKQYASFRKQQGDEILVKTEKIRELNNDLIEQRKEKEKIVAENKEVEAELLKEKKDQEALVATIRKKEKQYAAQIKKKQSEANAIDRQIDKLIRDAIAKSNKGAGKEAEKSSNFALTAEAKLVGNNFKSNKGNLPWPVEKGIVVRRFGVQPHPIVKSVNVQSNGVHIATEKGSKARAIFDGKVLGIQIIKDSNKAVLIQHGNFISVYNNLDKVYVKEGDYVSTKQEIGEIFTSKANNETVLKFMIYDNSKIQDPADWIFRM